MAAPWEKYQEDGPWKKYEKEGRADTGLVRGVYSGLSDLAGAPVDILNAGLGVVGLDSERPVGGSSWVKEKLGGINLPSGAPLTYQSRSELPENERPWAAGGEVLGAGTPMAFLPITFATYGKKVPAMLRPITDAARAAPKRFLATEMGGLAGAAQGAGLAEAVAPGNDTARLAGEVIGGFVNPVAAVGRTAGGITRGVKTLTNSFTAAGRESSAAKTIQNALIEMGEDPDVVAGMLTKQDLPGLNLTSGQKSGSPTLLAIEKKLGEKSAKFAGEAKQRGEDSFVALRGLMDDLEATGNPEALKVAAKVRQRYFDDLLSSRFQKAQADVNKSIAAFRGNKQTASARANQVLEDALADARKAESDLWGAVDKEIELPGEGIQEAYKGLRETILKEESLPSVVEGFVKRITKDGKITSGEAQRFRSRMLALARDARGKGDWDQARQFNKMADGAMDDLSAINTPEAQQAREYSFQLNEAFSRTFANDALGVKATGADRISPEAMLEKAFGTGGTMGDVRMKQIEGAAAFAGRSMANDQEEFLRAAAASSVNAETGKVNTSQLQKFLKENDSLLERFPTLKKELADAANAERLFKQVDSMKNVASKQISQRAAFAKLSNVEDPATVIGQSVKSATPEKDYSQLVKVAKRGGVEAIGGLKASTLDYATQQATTPNGFSFTKYRDVLNVPVRKNGPSMLEMMERQGVMNKGEVTRLKLILNRAEEIETAMSSRAAMDALGDSPDALFNLVVRVTGANIGGMGAVGHGAPLVASYAGSRYAQRLFEKIPQTRIKDVIIEAAENPQMMAALLKKPKLVKEKAKLERQLNAFLLQAGLIPDDE